MEPVESAAPGSLVPMVMMGRLARTLAPNAMRPLGGIGAYTIRPASSWVGKRPFGVS